MAVLLAISLLDGLVGAALYFHGRIDGQKEGVVLGLGGFRMSQHYLTAVFGGATLALGGAAFAAGQHRLVGLAPAA